MMYITLNGASNNQLTLNYILKSDANLRFKLSDFDLKKFILMVGDQLYIEIQNVFNRQ